jgi:hypothetical protein
MINRLIGIIASSRRAEVAMTPSAWAALMLISYESIHGTLGATEQAELVARLEDTYLYDTFGYGVGGQEKTVADFIYLLNISGDITARTLVKSGDTLRWDIDGTVTVQDDLPNHTLGAGAGIITFTSTDGWSGVTEFNLVSDNFILKCPKFNFPNATVFYVAGNNFAGLQDISLMTSATDIWFHINPLLTSFIGATSSANITQLRGHTCGFTGTFDISGYSGLGGYFECGVNPYTNIILPSSSQTFTEFYLNVCPNLGVIDFSPLTNLTESNNVIIQFISNGHTAAEMNEMLDTLDNMSTGGFTGRTISAAGSNAAPDGSSGGFDGLAAVTSLTSKGFTVTVN